MSIQKTLNPLRATQTPDEARLRAEPHPYRSYRLVPGQRAGEIRINQHGFRGPEIDPSKPCIVVLGNSTLFGSGLRETQTITHHLAALHPSQNVVNAGITGYTIPQELLLLVELYASLEIEQVVLLDGYTECFFAFHNRALNLPPYYYDRRFERERAVSAWSRVRARCGWLRPENHGRERPEPADVASSYHRYAHHVRDLCAGRGTRCHFVVQPTLAWQARGSAAIADAPLREQVEVVERQYPGLTEYIQRCYEAFELLSWGAHDPPLHFAGGLLDREQLPPYRDLAHYTERGSRIVADYLDGLLAERVPTSTA